jgi:hypothetical protein
MTEKAVSASADGPVMVEVLMLGRYGQVRVELDPALERATLELRTADASGPSVDAIDDGVLAWEAEDRELKLLPNGRSAPVVPRELPGGRLVAQIQADDAQPGSRVEVVARVPLGSAVDVDVDHADVDVAPRPGTRADVPGASAVSVESQGSEVRVATADEVFVEGASFAWVGEAREAVVLTQKGNVEVGRATGNLTVRVAEGDVRIGDAAGRLSMVTVQRGDITGNVSGAGEHEFKTGNGLVTGAISADAPRAVSVSVHDSRGPGALHDQRPTPGGEAATGSAAASTEAARGPASTAAAEVAAQAANRVSRAGGVGRD